MLASRSFYKMTRSFLDHNTIMASFITTFLLLLSSAITVSCTDELKAVQTARLGLLQGRSWAQSSSRLDGSDLVHSGYVGDAMSDCVMLYEESESRLTRLISAETRSRDDTLALLSGAMANHRACLDGLEGKGIVEPPTARNLTAWLSQALTLYSKYMGPDTEAHKGEGIFYFCFQKLFLKINLKFTLT